MTQQLLPIRIVLAILGIFLAGGVAGGFVGARLELRQNLKHTKIEHLPTKVMDMLDARLNLTAEQTTELEPIVDQACGELRLRFQQNHDDVSEILEKYYHQMTPQLNEEQTAILETMETELHRKAGQLKKNSLRLSHIAPELCLRL